MLHLQLKSYICGGSLLEDLLPNTMHGPAAGSGQTHASEVSSASFGSVVSLGSVLFLQNFKRLYDLPPSCLTFQFFFGSIWSPLQNCIFQCWYQGCLRNTRGNRDFGQIASRRETSFPRSMWSCTGYGTIGWA